MKSDNQSSKWDFRNFSNKHLIKFHGQMRWYHQLLINLDRDPAFMGLPIINNECPNRTANWNSLE